MKSKQQVGPFELVEIIGLGGMGEVWKAVHRNNGEAVAIKVITSDRASDPKYRDSFLREVQAVAGLNHPGVVAIYDFGEVPGSRRSSLPWYAMEIAETSLAEVALGDWQTLQRVLSEMLDALAHAHARRIIHRDLKPENVLLTKGHAVKLTDFGMAHVTEYSNDTGNIFGPGGGTPDFMSPEQFRGQWRKFGPWTDLYALGCVAWELATGIPPFPGETIVEIAMMHMSHQPPRLAPLFEVPKRFEGWLRRLTQKHLLDRYRRAADAQWALVHDVGASYDLSDRDTRPRGRPGMATDLDLVDTVNRDKLRAARRQTLENAASTLQLGYALTPPFPATWRTDHVPTRLGGTGLGLFGVREIPFVGREGAREYLWERLRDVDETTQNEVIFVHGDPGVGRTRFGQWISRRADELGAATVLKAVHNPIPSRSDGLAGAVKRFLGIEGVDITRARQISTDRLGPSFDPTLILDMLYRRGSEESHGTSTFAAPMQRYAAVERLLVQLSQERAVIFFVDDAQWGADTLLFIQHLLARKTRTLIVANVRNGSIMDRYWERQLLSEAELSSDASTIHLQPLTPEERRQLMEEMLDLEPGLASIVAERSQGIPLFATQLVGDWVQRGLLEEGRGGFQLTAGAQFDLPNDVYSMWNEAVDELSKSLGSNDVRPILEVAALLGSGDQEWANACLHLNLKVPAGLQQQLVARRLATQDAAGWSFQHGMLRESLERSAEESGRASSIYSAASAGVDRLDPVRAAEFQIRAGQLDEAVTSLLKAVDVNLLTTSVDQSRQHLDIVEDLLDRLEVRDSDPRRGQLQAARVDVHSLAGDIPTARQYAADLVAAAQRHGWRREIGYGHLHLGMLGEDGRDPSEQVLRHFDEALVVFDELSDDGGRARTYRALAGYQLGLGKPAVASSLNLKALGVVEDLEDSEGVVECLVALGHSKLAEHQNVEARGYFERARAEAEAGEFRLVVAAALEGLGEVAEVGRDIVAAEAHYREAQQLGLAIGSQTGQVAGVRLALLLLEQDQFEPARQTLAQTREAVLAGTLPQIAQIVDAGLMACAAHDNDVELFDEVNREIRGLLRNTPSPDVRVPETAFLAGRVWAKNGDRMRARKAFDVARNVFLALGEEQQADAVAIAIGRL